MFDKYLLDDAQLVRKATGTSISKNKTFLTFPS